MSPIRIGILGAGTMATAHAAAWAGIGEAEVVGVMARNPIRARTVANLFKAEPFTRLDALMASVDAVDVCLPSAIHHEFVVPALDAGKHVFCETPLALELDRARQMRDAARDAGRLLQVGLLMRSVGAYEHVKAIATSGAHGRLVSVTTWRLGSYLHPAAPDRKTHYGDPSTELMTFDLDFILWLMGRPLSLSANAARSTESGVGEISAVLAYPNGCHATVTASGLMPPGFAFTTGFRVLFERACFEHHAVFEGTGPPRSSFTIFNGNSPGTPVEVPPRNPFQVELQRFVDCIRGRADPELLDVERAIEALELSVATQRAIAG